MYIHTYLHTYIHACGSTYEKKVFTHRPSPPGFTKAQSAKVQMPHLLYMIFIVSSYIICMERVAA